MLMYGMTGGNESRTLILTVIVCAAALVAMALAFKRNPDAQNVHLAALSLFALWSTYHRTYDSVLCILPAALLIDFIRRRKFATFSWVGLAGLGLLALGIPGMLTERLGLDAAQLSANPIGFLGLHIEQLLVFGLFWALLVLVWKSPPEELTHSKSVKLEAAVAGAG